MRNVFITGGTGYLGSSLIPELLSKRHSVTALVRSGSEHKVAPGCRTVSGDALDADSYQAAVCGNDTFVHMVGVPHPSPAKAELFRSIDLSAVRSTVAAAIFARVAHLVYLSVAHPAPVMKAYVQSRIEAEELIRSSDLNATFLRPWYVLGPGHRWAYLLLPVYWFFETIPSSRETASRLGLVSRKQMIAALVNAVENPTEGIRVVDVPTIRHFSEERD